MSFVGYQELIRDGDTVIVFLGHDSMMPLKMSLGTTTQTKYGALRHSGIVGKKYGSKICTLGGKGWVYVLHPSPELWTVNLPHRTQVLYFTDISLLTMELELKPGSVVVEAGTGSGSVSHAVARTIAPDGHLYTFEFHEQRAKIAAEEFTAHQLSHIVTATHRDVIQDGFLLDFEYKADAIFLDLPSPWTVIQKAKKVLNSSGGRICSFSPCIEQVQRVCLELDNLGFTDIKTKECLIRPYDVRTINLTLPNLGEPKDLPETSAMDQSSRSSNGSEKGEGDAKAREDYKFEEPKPLNASGENCYLKKCAVPRRETPGHTGYLTFASLYSLEDTSVNQATSST